MRVLALDIAARASGAAFDGPNGRPAFSTLRQELFGDDFGSVGVIFKRWLLDLFAVTQPDHVAFESPWLPMGDRAGRERTGMTDTKIPRLLLGLAFLAETLASDAGIECTEHHVQSVRRHFVGHGRPTNPKETVMHRCRLLGWSTKNEHEADAAAVYSLVKSSLDPKWSPQSTVLFGAGMRA